MSGKFNKYETVRKHMQRTHKNTAKEAAVADFQGINNYDDILADQMPENEVNLDACMDDIRSQ